MREDSGEDRGTGQWGGGAPTPTQVTRASVPWWEARGHGARATPLLRRGRVVGTAGGSPQWSSTAFLCWGLAHLPAVPWNFL